MSQSTVPVAAPKTYSRQLFDVFLTLFAFFAAVGVFSFLLPIVSGSPSNNLVEEVDSLALYLKAGLWFGGVGIAVRLLYDVTLRHDVEQSATGGTPSVPPIGTHKVPSWKELRRMNASSRVPPGSPVPPPMDPTSSVSAVAKALPDGPFYVIQNPLFVGMMPEWVAAGYPSLEQLKSRGINAVLVSSTATDGPKRLL